jgi:hypothetical protein
LATAEEKAWRCSACDETLDPDDPGDPGATDPELRLADALKRRTRNCVDESNPHIGWAWAPDLKRCPKSQLDEEVWTHIKWWTDWKAGLGLPFGGRTALDEPGFVADVIRLCENEHAKIQAARAKEG